MSVNAKSIKYADSTFSVLMGCDGCFLWTENHKNCYAGKITEISTNKKTPAEFTKPQLYMYRLEKELYRYVTGIRDTTRKRRGKEHLIGFPRIIVLNDMGDTFTPSIELDYLHEVIRFTESLKKVWIVSTRYPNRCVDFFSSMDIPSNWWLMTTVSFPDDLWRIEELLKLRNKATILGVFLMPVYDYIDLRPYLSELDWVVMGGENGPLSAPSNPRGLRRIVHDVDYTHRVPFLFNHWGRWLPYERLASKPDKYFGQKGTIPTKKMMTMRRFDKPPPIHDWDSGLHFKPNWMRETGRLFDNVLYNNMPRKWLGEQK